MNKRTLLSYITSAALMCALTGCGYSSLYNPDQADIKDFYTSLDKSNLPTAVNKTPPVSKKVVIAKRNTKHHRSKYKHRTSRIHHTIKKKALAEPRNNYYTEFSNTYQNKKIIPENKQVTHQVGDNQFNNKYRNGIFSNLTLNPLTNSTILASERIWVASIANYNGWFLRSELNKLLHTVASIGDYKYVLRVKLSESTSAFSSDIYGVPNRFKYLLNASYSVEDFNTSKVIYNSVSQAVTNYTLSRSLTALTFSEKDAKEKALTYISSKIYTNIVAWLYHNEHQIAVLNPKPLITPKTPTTPPTPIENITLYPLPLDMENIYYNHLQKITPYTIKESFTTQFIKNLKDFINNF